MALLLHRGLAVQVWGEPRLTRDIDLSLLTGFGDEAAFIDTLLEKYATRLPNGRQFAIENRTLLLLSATGTSIDASLAALPFEDAMMRRAVRVELMPGQALDVCSPEDLLIMKLFAGRDLDVRDAETVIIRQPALDWQYIEANLGVLDELRGTSGLLARAANLRRKRC